MFKMNTVIHTAGPIRELLWMEGRLFFGETMVSDKVRALIGWEFLTITTNFLRSLSVLNLGRKQIWFCYEHKHYILREKRLVKPFLIFFNPFPLILDHSQFSESHAFTGNSCFISNFLISSSNFTTKNAALEASPELGTVNDVLAM